MKEAELPVLPFPPDNSAREELGALFDYSVNRVRGESTLGK